MRGALVLGVAVFACQQSSTDVGPKGELRDHVAGEGQEVVAEVGSEVVTRADVQVLVADTGLPPRRALGRLVDERLLAAEAHRRGYGAREDVRREERRAGAHALLEDAIESAEGPQDLPGELVKERLDEAVRKGTVPELRRADHVLFRAADGAGEGAQQRAREGARKALAQMRVDGPDVVLSRWSATGQYADGVTVEAVELPAVPAEGRFDKAFTDAIFALAAPGVVADIVETRHGYHAIALREIVPRRVPSRESLEPNVRQTLLVERRRERLAALLEGLRQRIPVEPHPDVMARAFAAPDEP